MTTQRFIYEFDNFRVDSGQFLLTRAGESKTITPTVFRILLILLESAGQVVSKNELMSSVWPDSFVEEGNLNRNVSTLRKVLGETPRDHTYIETLPKMGYRFIVPVRKIDYQRPTGSQNILNLSAHHIVGRDKERKELLHAYERAEKGHGGLICVNGDVGMGKTALMDAFLENLVNAGHTFHLARARCSESLTEGEAYMPWIEALGAFAREGHFGDLLQKAAPEWHREIFHNGSGQVRRMKRELLDFFGEISSVYPLIVILDDFHWSDVSSADLLAYLSTRLESTRVMIVVCYRFGEMKVHRHPFVQIRSDLLSRNVCTELQLRFIDQQNVEAYLALEYPQVQFPKDYAAFLQAKTEGNPLFIRKLVMDKGDLTDSIRAMVMGRIDRVSADERQLLLTASVQGRDFDSLVLARSLGMNPEEVEEKLRNMDEVHGLIQRIREEELVDGNFSVRYRFVYGFYQEVCYASLAPSRKASLNASLAEAFLTHYGT